MTFVIFLEPYLLFMKSICVWGMVEMSGACFAFWWPLRKLFNKNELFPLSFDPGGPKVSFLEQNVANMPPLLKISFLGGRVPSKALKSKMTKNTSSFEDEMESRNLSNAWELVLRGLASVAALQLYFPP